MKRQRIASYNTEEGRVRIFYGRAILNGTKENEGDIEDEKRFGMITLDIVVGGSLYERYILGTHLRAEDFVLLADKTRALVRDEPEPEGLVAELNRYISELRGDGEYREDLSDLTIHK